MKPPDELQLFYKIHPGSRAFVPSVASLDKGAAEIEQVAGS
jgi:hypothetical protein